MNIEITVLWAVLLIFVAFFALGFYLRMRVLQRKLIGIESGCVGGIQAAVALGRFEEAKRFAGCFEWVAKNPLYQDLGECVRNDGPIEYDSHFFHFRDAFCRMQLKIAAKCFDDAQTAFDEKNWEESERLCEEGWNALREVVIIGPEKCLLQEQFSALEHKIAIVQDYVTACETPSDDVEKKNKEMLDCATQAAGAGFGLPDFEVKLQEVWRATLDRQIRRCVSSLTDPLGRLLVSVRSLPENDVKKGQMVDVIENLVSTFADITRDKP